MGYYYDFWMRYFQFEGRTPRKDFFVTQLTSLLIITCLLLGEEFNTFGFSSMWRYLKVAFFMTSIIPSVAISVRRIRDSKRPVFNAIWAHLGVFVLIFGLAGHASLIVFAVLFVIGSIFYFEDSYPDDLMGNFKEYGNSTVIKEYIEGEEEESNEVVGVYNPDFNYENSKIQFNPAFRNGVDPSELENDAPDDNVSPEDKIVDPFGMEKLGRADDQSGDIPFRTQQPLTNPFLDDKRIIPTIVAMLVVSFFLSSGAKVETVIQDEINALSYVESCKVVETIPGVLATVSVKTIGNIDIEPEMEIEIRSILSEHMPKVSGFNVNKDLN